MKDKRYYTKRKLPNDVHLPNKEEAKELRKLKKLTKLTEKELRKFKKYRKILSEASKKSQEVSKDRSLINYKYHFRILKEVLRENNLPLKHPKIKEKYFEKINLKTLYDYLMRDKPDPKFEFLVDNYKEGKKL